MNVIMDTTWVEILDTIAPAEFLTLKLFKNDHVPAFTDTLADYTEANFSGYSFGAALAWGAAFINGSNAGEIDAAMITETHNGGPTSNLIYGIYVVDGLGGLRYAERFVAPVSMAALGNQVKYVPIVTLINQ